MSAVDAVDRLVAREIEAQCAGMIIGSEIVVLEATTSTHDAILQRVGGKACQGLVIFAEEQTAGRGQRGNRWESAPHQGLWFSILLHPRIELNQSARLTSWAAEAIAAVLKQESSLVPRIKLPNDVYINAGKVAGVLVEMRAQIGAPHIAIAGIGINVNQSRQDFPDSLQGRATSLAIALGRPVNRQKLAIALLRELDRSYHGLFG